MKYYKTTRKYHENTQKYSEFPNNSKKNLVLVAFQLGNRLEFPLEKAENANSRVETAAGKETPIVRPRDGADRLRMVVFDQILENSLKTLAIA